MKWVIGAFIVVFFPIIIGAPLFGMLISPWAPFWFSGHSGAIAGEPSIPVVVPDPGDLAPAHGFVSDYQRYLLALAVGWVGLDAITATAISIAEDGSGDPAALSPVNRNGSRDLGLMQINSAHWPEFGGAQALADPLTNFRAGHVIYSRGGWTQWCTYPGGCGGGLGSPAWPQALARARAASQNHPPVDQA